MGSGWGSGSVSGWGSGEAERDPAASVGVRGVELRVQPIERVPPHPRRPPRARLGAPRLGAAHLGAALGAPRVGAALERLA